MMKSQVRFLSMAPIFNFPLIDLMGTEHIALASEAIKKLNQSLDSEVVIYNGDIDQSGTDTVIDLINSRKSRSNLLLILVTDGGDPNAAYRLARFLQRRFSALRLCVSGRCKSAGTLIALGASELIISEVGELGPLDTQLAKAEDQWEKSSGLNIESAMNSLQLKSWESFHDFTIRLKANFRMPLRTCAEIASTMTQGLFGPIFRQIDPVHLGEVDRAVRIAHEYGEKLNSKNQNLKEGSLAKLITGYSSHGSVIDIDEAVELFKRVRAPSNVERELLDFLNKEFGFSRIGRGAKDRFVWFLDELIEAAIKYSQQQQQGATDEPDDASEGAGTPEGREPTSTGATGSLKGKLEVYSGAKEEPGSGKPGTAKKSADRGQTSKASGIR